MSSPKDGSVQQTNSPETTSVQIILQKLKDLRGRLLEVTKAKVDDSVQDNKGEEGKPAKAKVDDSVQHDEGKEGEPADEEERKREKEMHTQLDKVCKELHYMIREFEKLKNFEDNLRKPLTTLEGNVNDILKDLERLRSPGGILKQIEQNLKVLRSNITKVKIQIPLQHQASNLISDASRYLQATVASREGGDLPNLYEAAKEIEIEGSFFKEIQDKYDRLDTKLKLCLLCFAIFPEKAEIKKSLLRFWWLGERLIEHPNVLEGKEKKDRVNDVLGVLINRGFIEPIEKKSRLPATSYKMHPIVRSLLIRLAKKDNFFDYDSKGIPTMDISKCKKSCLIKSEGHSHWFSQNPFPMKVEKQQDEAQKINSETQQKTDAKGQQPTNSENQKKRYQEHEREEKQLLRNLEELQTLFNISKQFPDLPEEKFSKMKGINVLYLGRWESTAERHMEVEKTEFLKGLKNMKKLRFFSLQGISGISKLPNSLGKLFNLRFLDLKACHNLEELPKELGSLKKLTYLDISECYLIDNMPRQLTSLSELQVLKGFVISKNRHSCTLGNLATLSKLKKLTINVNNDKFLIDEAEGDLRKFQGLRKLRIAWGAGGDESPTLINKTKDEKKGNGNQETNGDKSKGHKGQQNDAAKPGPRKLNMPWGACGEGSSKTVPEKNRNDNKDAGKQNIEGDIKLVKLDLQCFPKQEPPRWLVPEKLASLKSLYIRGGRLSYLGEQKGSEEWKVETLCLKYLTGVQINWKDLQTQFPRLTHLERVDCPGITFCPCDANGVWRNLEKGK